MLLSVGVERIVHGRAEGREVMGDGRDVIACPMSKSN